MHSLKTAVTMAPILKHPNPKAQFIVEVHQIPSSGEKQKMYPVTFFSRKLNDAEKNYDMGNRELLAVQLALEEWRHWLLNNHSWS